MSKHEIIPLSIKLIILLRNDLRLLCPNDKLSLNFLAWLITSGFKEYASLLQDPDVPKFFCRKAPGHGHSFTLLECLTWITRVDLQNLFPLPIKSNEYLEWFYTQGIRESLILRTLTKNTSNLRCHKKFMPIDITNLTVKSIFSEIKNQPSSLGVNLIGHAHDQTGLGEDFRQTLNALKAVNIPTSALNFSSKSNKNTRFLINNYQENNNKPINIFCMTASDTARFYSELGNQQFNGCYNIGYWPWELSKWPKELNVTFSLINEIWVSSSHTYAAIKKNFDGPIHIMPLAVEIPSILTLTNKEITRYKFSLPQKAILFCFSFDLNSSIYRKNPNACIDAFITAFPLEKFSRGKVGLVLKCHKPFYPNKHWENLKKLAEKDNRIHIIEVTVSRKEILELYKSCDCFLSLHRAEGFGRCIAEAIQLGLHVICTGYSGNIDFCKKNPKINLVDYKLIRVKKDLYPHFNSQVWAEPNILQAINFMKKFFASAPTEKIAKKLPAFSKFIVGIAY